MNQIYFRIIINSTFKMLMLDLLKIWVSYHVLLGQLMQSGIDVKLFIIILIPIKLLLHGHPQRNRCSKIFLSDFIYWIFNWLGIDVPCPIWAFHAFTIFTNTRIKVHKAKSRKIKIFMKWTDQTEQTNWCRGIGRFQYLKLLCH